MRKPKVDPWEMPQQAAGRFRAEMNKPSPDLELEVVNPGKFKKLASALKSELSRKPKSGAKRSVARPSQRLAPSTVAGMVPLGPIGPPVRKARRPKVPPLPPAEHTPGPWRIYGQADMLKRGIDDLVIVASSIGPGPGDDNGGYGPFITNVGGPSGLVYAEPRLMAVNLANARLIAAAPDLLAACKRALAASSERERDQADTDLWRAIKDATEGKPIEKATKGRRR